MITMFSYRVMGVMPLTVYFAVLLIFAEILVSGLFIPHGIT
ncbi:hypothetical protein R5R61_06340 [Oenococcus oeni]